MNPSEELAGDYRFGSNGEDVSAAIVVGPSTGDLPWITGKTCGNGFPTTDGIRHQLSHYGVFVLVLGKSPTATLAGEMPPIYIVSYRRSKLAMGTQEFAKLSVWN